MREKLIRERNISGKYIDEKQVHEKQMPGVRTRERQVYEKQVREMKMGVDDG